MPIYLCADPIALMPERGPKWMPLRAVLRWLPEMALEGVSEVARSDEGFLSAYASHGTAASTRRALVGPRYPGQTWGQRRAAFIARHLPQYEANPTRRRWLALIAWAYRPDGAPASAVA